LRVRSAPPSPLFPSTTLFRSRIAVGRQDRHGNVVDTADLAAGADTVPGGADGVEFGAPFAERPGAVGIVPAGDRFLRRRVVLEGDRKSTRLNSSHVKTSYAVF